MSAGIEACCAVLDRSRRGSGLTLSHLIEGKAARKRELKRNKEERAKVREVATVKKDTRSLEADIRRLESKGGGALSQVEREELGQLKAEVRRIREAKEAYVKEHPEHRKFVFAREMEEEEESKRKQKEGQEMEEKSRDAKRPWEGRDPRWSQDYDPVFNPLGAPPPGMPYREKSRYACWRVVLTLLTRSPLISKGAIRS